MEIFDGDIRPYDDWEPYQNNRYFNAVTVTYGELVDGGFIDWTDPAFSWDYYDEEQKARVENLIAGRFWLREISVLPPGAWRISFIETLNEAMTAARPMYEALEKTAGILVESDEFHKSRSIGSEFPATLLNGSTGDYASDGRDYEYETVRDGNAIRAIEALQAFRHPDIYILDKLEACFSCLVSVNIDGF